VVRQRHGRHAVLMQPGEEISEAYRPVKEAVLAVKVQVGEWR